MSPQILEDRKDFQCFLDEHGYTEEGIRPFVQSTADQVPMPEGFDALELRPSPIHGLGMFAVRDLTEGELLAPARLAGKRTPAGRYTNHSAQPNAIFVAQPNDDLHLVAARPIAAGEEVVIDYRQAGRANSQAKAVMQALQAGHGRTLQ